MKKHPPQIPLVVQVLSWCILIAAWQPWAAWLLLGIGASGIAFGVWVLIQVAYIEDIEQQIKECDQRSLALQIDLIALRRLEQ